MTTDEALEFYLKDHSLFLADFWQAGNKELNVGISQRKDVESGTWYVATWQTAKGDMRYITAQRWKLCWERVMRKFLEDEAAKDAPTTD